MAIAFDKGFAFERIVQAYLAQGFYVERFVRIWHGQGQYGDVADC